MLKGVKYFITFESGEIQMIDFWTFIHEVPSRSGHYDYELYVYDEAYENEEIRSAANSITRIYSGVHECI